MPRKSIGDRPLTAAERQARTRERNKAQTAAMRETLRRILCATSIYEARRLATNAVDSIAQLERIRHPNNRRKR